MKKLFLFDADGVIVDSFENGYQGVLKFIKQHSDEHLTRDEYKEFMETSVLTNIMKKAGLNATKRAITPEEIDLIFETYHTNTLIEGMPEVIEQLSEKAPIVIITSSLSSYVGDLLESFNLIHHVSGILGADAAVHKDVKIKMALEEFNLGITDSIFITDTIGDVAEAQKVGVETVGVTWGFHDNETMERGAPNHIVHSPDELFQYLVGERKK